MSEGVTAYEKKINRGLSEQESKVLDHLIAAVEEFQKLPPQHPDEAEDFKSGIHLCQYVMMARAARTHFPGGWPIVVEIR